ncbi:MAG TPA: DUF937 domain-containing protein [Gemmatimonadales bacterium]|nr:DUF937 domain-containing protein [Gemmatimonadales bacterium]
MSLLEMIQGQLGPDAVRQIGQRIGAEPTETSQAINAALPMLVAAMARNTRDPAKAQGLARAIEEDHDGGLLDDLGGFLGSPKGRAADGDGILQHVLGNRRGAVEQQLGRGTGLGSAQMAQLLPLLAPIVMAALGKTKRQGGLDAGGLAGVLGGEQAQLQQRAPGLMGTLSGLLDRDGDGSAIDEIGGMLGGVLKKR